MEKENTSPTPRNDDLNRGSIGDPLDSDNAFSDKGLRNADLTHKAINKGENRETIDKNQKSLYGMDEDESLQSVHFATTENSDLNEHYSKETEENK